MRKGSGILVLLIAVSLGCALTEATPTQTVGSGAIVGQAVVDSVEILILESFPVQVNAVARGNLPDGCTGIDQVLQERSGDTFLVTITTLRAADAVCTQALVPFEQIIALDVYGLAAGVYTVTVNGVSETFDLVVDNALPPEGSAGATIGGLVWHDLCAPPWEGTPPPVPPEGCADFDEEVGYVANGTLEPGEPGIAGALVALGAGDCPSTGLATAVTALDGSYLFGELGAGTYCVSVDALDESNTAILIPGGWTHAPIVDEAKAMATVILAEGALELDVSFGWDYQFSP